MVLICVQESDVLAAQSLESTSQIGHEAVTSVDNLPPNSSQQELQVKVVLCRMLAVVVM